MAIPSGSGTEVIKTTQLTAVTNSVRTLITGVANHIYTVLSIIVTETSEATGEKIDIYLADSDGSSNPVMIVYSQSIEPFQVFVWNDKFSYTGGTQKLQIIAKSAANFDVICTYIDQDWS
tara:strand:+ start:797 stop:1156 length:360 start_codon:yes stop_codon:yes gene_type:complete